MAWAGRRSIRILGGVFLVILVLFVAVKIFLPAEKIRDLALEQACLKLGREVSVGQVDVSIKGGLGVRLSDFVIPNPQGFGGEPLLRTKTLDLKLEIAPLFHKEFRFKRLVVDSTVLTLIRREDGLNNFTFEPVESSAEASSSQETDSSDDAPPPLSIAGLTLNNGQFSYSDATAQDNGLQQVKISDLALNMSLDTPLPGIFSIEGRLDTEKVTLISGAQIPELTTSLDFNLIYDTNSSELSIIQADVQVLNIPLALAGQISLAEKYPRGALQVQLDDRPLVELAKFLPPTMVGKVKGNQDDGTVSSQWDIDLTGDPEAPFHAEGTLNVLNANLSLLQPFFPPKQKGNLAGRSDLGVTIANLTNDPSLLSYDGTMAIKSLSFTESGLVDELINLDSKVKFDNNKIQIENCRAQFASGTFDLNGNLKDPFPYFLPEEMQKTPSAKIPHLDFELRSARLDVDRLLPAASPGGPTEPNKSNKLQPPKSTDMEFPNITSEGTFAADTLIYMQVPLTNVVGKMSLENQLLKIHDVKSDVYQGQVNGAMDIDLQDLNDPTFNGQYQTQAIEVNNFVSRFADLSGVLFGHCNLDGQFSAHGRDPEVIRNSLSLQTKAALQQGRILTSGNVRETLNLLATQMGQTLNQEQTLSDLVTHIKVADGRVALDNVTTRLGQFGDLNFGGYYGFDGSLEYQGHILFTEAQTAQIFNQSGMMSELNSLLGAQKPSRLQLPLTVGGHRSDPKVKIDFSSMVEDLQNRVVKEQGQKLEDEVKNKLGDLFKKLK